MLNVENVNANSFEYTSLARRALVTRMIAKTQLKLLVQCQSLCAIFESRCAALLLSTFRVIEKKKQ